ncbi:hypothetical protein EV652_104304 [Kribbella steppae]|uniref:Uncharacterized protein n=1 Tax=Kribbella steppae TaxID=2512223 RepID=A0A4R2HQF0_9ACTN|nr:hypothetical protein EV652_104304 [Kribbella steppae]
MRCYLHKAGFYVVALWAALTLNFFRTKWQWQVDDRQVAAPVATSIGRLDPAGRSAGTTLRPARLSPYGANGLPGSVHSIDHHLARPLQLHGKGKDGVHELLERVQLTPAEVMAQRRPA